MKEILSCLKFGIKSAVKGYLWSVAILLIISLLCLGLYPAFSWNFNYSWIGDLLQQVPLFQILNGIAVGIGIIYGIFNTLDEYDVL